MVNLQKRNNGNGRNGTKQAEFAKHGMTANFQKSGMSEAQAKAIADAIVGYRTDVIAHADASEARTNKRFDELSVQIAENAKANAERHEKSEKANAERHEKSEASYEKLLAQISENQKTNTARHDVLIGQMFELHNAMRRQTFWIIGALGGIASMVFILSRFL